MELAPEEWFDLQDIQVRGVTLYRPFDARFPFAMNWIGMRYRKSDRQPVIKASLPVEVGDPNFVRLELADRLDWKLDDAVREVVLAADEDAFEAKMMLVQFRSAS